MFFWHRALWQRALGYIPSGSPRVSRPSDAKRSGRRRRLVLALRATHACVCVCRGKVWLSRTLGWDILSSSSFFPSRFGKEPHSAPIRQRTLFEPRIIISRARSPDRHELAVCFRLSRTRGRIAQSWGPSQGNARLAEPEKERRASGLVCESFVRARARYRSCFFQHVTSVIDAGAARSA